MDEARAHSPRSRHRTKETVFQARTRSVCFHVSSMQQWLCLCVVFLRCSTLALATRNALGCNSGCKPLDHAHLIADVARADIKLLEAVLPPCHYLMHASYNRAMDLAINQQRFQEVRCSTVCLHSFVCVFVCVCVCVCVSACLLPFLPRSLQLRVLLQALVLGEKSLVVYDVLGKRTDPIRGVQVRLPLLDIVCVSVPLSVCGLRLCVCLCVSVSVSVSVCQCVHWLTPTRTHINTLLLVWNSCCAWQSCTVCLSRCGSLPPPFLLLPKLCKQRMERTA